MIDFARNYVEYQPANVATIKSKLQRDGYVHVQFSQEDLSFSQSSEDFFISFIETLGGECLKHNEDKDSLVWHVWPIEKSSANQVKQLARSQTCDEFAFHTDCSYETNPPEYVALFVLREDRSGGGLFEIISVADVVKLLSNDVREYLLTEQFRIEIPEEFRQSLETDHIYGPILLDEERIRFRYDIISGGNRDQLDQLNTVINQIEPFRPRLKQYSMILLNNQTYLHGRSKVLDLERHLLRIRFNLPLPYDVFTVYNRNKLRSEYFRFTHGFYDYLEEQHHELYQILVLIVEQYHQSTAVGEEIRQTFGFNSKIDHLLKQLNRYRPDYQIGAYRPDILLSEGDQFRLNGKYFFRPKFCEINARFPLNGYLLSAGLCSTSYSNRVCEPFLTLIENIIDQAKFDRSKAMFVLKSKENGFDIHLFDQYWKNKYEQPCHFVDPKHLKIEDDSLIDEKTYLVIDQFILELHQEEILDLSDEILQFLMHNEQIRYINDLRTIFLLHDKRLFTLLSNPSFLYTLLGRQPSSSFMQLFPTTYIIDRIPAYLKERILKDQEHWVIKPNSAGKGENVVIGLDVPIDEWRDQLLDPDHHQWIVQKYHPLIEYHSMKPVGMMICWNNLCCPIGIVRMSSKKIVNISHGGAYVRCYVPRRYQHLAEDRSILTKKELHEQLMTMKYRDPLWNEQIYLSASGGTGGKRLCFATDIGENQLQRQILVRMMLEENVLSDRDICLNIFQCNNLYRSFEIFNDFCSIANCTAIPMGADASDENLVQMVDYFQPNVLMGTPYRLTQFARYLQATGRRKIKFEKIIFAGEPLYQAKRNYLEAIFYCSIYLGLYGSAETGVFACQTKEYSSSQIYLYPKDIIHLEISNDQIIATNNIRRRNQLVRFNTGDHGRLLPYAKNDRYGLLEVFHSQRIFSVGDYDLAKSDIDRIMGPLNVLEWQLILDYSDRETQQICLLFRFTPSNDTSVETIRTSIIEGLDKCFYGHLTSFSRQIIYHFESIDIKDFIRSETSNKLLRIIDRRT